MGVADGGQRWATALRPAPRARRRAAARAAAAVATHVVDVEQPSRASSRAAVTSWRRARAAAARWRGRRARRGPCASPNTSGSKTATSCARERSAARPRRGRLLPVDRWAEAVLHDGRVAGGLEVQVDGSPPRRRASTRNQRFSGWMPLSGAPSASWSSPSAWKPGPSPRKPRSMTTSTLSPANAAGTAPVISNHHVDHGSPHGVPGPTGRTSRLRPRAAPRRRAPARRGRARRTSRAAYGLGGPRASRAR